MKKTLKLVVPVLCVALLALGAFVSCASSGGGGGGGGGDGAAPYSVDLSTVSVSTWTRATKKFTDPVPGVKNVEPFGTIYDGVIIHFPELPEVKGYARMTVKAKFFNADGGELNQVDGNGMIVMFYDVNGDLEGPEMGAGKNTPLKEFNLGGFSGTISTDKGSRIFLNQNPGGLLLQCSNVGVKYIEIAEVTFHS